MTHIRRTHLKCILQINVPVAQLDKASDCESEDWGFKSLQGYFLYLQSMLSNLLDAGLFLEWNWGISSIGRLRALQARGTGIETLMLHFFFSEKYKKTKHLNTNSHIVPHFGLASIAWMAERSKALDSSSSIFGCVGSNPTPSIFLYE